jgi:hypothetical protein
MNIFGQHSKPQRKTESLSFGSFETTDYSEVDTLQ